MSVNPYPNLPHDKGNNVMQNVAPTASVLAKNTLERGIVSSVYSLTPDTTFIEIAAISAPAAMRWVSSVNAFGPATSVITAQGTENFDHIIASGTVRQFAVPIEKMYQAPSSMVGANILNGLYVRVAVISLAAAGSVMVSQY